MPAFNKKKLVRSITGLKLAHLLSLLLLAGCASKSSYEQYYSKDAITPINTPIKITYTPPQSALITSVVENYQDGSTKRESSISEIKKILKKKGLGRFHFEMIFTSEDDAVMTVETVEGLDGRIINFSVKSYQTRDSQDLMMQNTTLNTELSASGENPLPPELESYLSPMFEAMPKPFYSGLTLRSGDKIDLSTEAEANADMLAASFEIMNPDFEPKILSAKGEAEVVGYIKINKHTGVLFNESSSFKIKHGYLVARGEINGYSIVDPTTGVEIEAVMTFVLSYGKGKSYTTITDTRVTF